MNKSFKSIWNEALGAWVAASELDRARGKRVASSRSACTHAADAGTVAGIATKPVLSPRRLVVMMAAAYLGLFQTGAHAQYSAGGGSATGGASSIAIGNGSVASQVNSTAYGNLSTAAGVSSTAIGPGAHAMGSGSTAIGINAQATGVNSASMGV